MQIEEGQPCTTNSPQSRLAFDAINAWRVFELHSHAREAPETPAGETLSETETEVIKDSVRPGPRDSRPTARVPIRLLPCSAPCQLGSLPPFHTTPSRSICARPPPDPNTKSVWGPRLNASRSPAVLLS